jgi:anti-sigma-K factor RskA
MAMQSEADDDTIDLLVAYALGALEPAEMERVGRLLEERPELRATLAELRATADLLPYGLPASAPPAGLRQRALDHATRRAPRTPAPAADPARRLRGWLYGLGGLAAAALGALLIALASLSGARAELAQARAELARAQEQVAAAQRQVAALDAERAQLAQAIAGAETIGRLEGPGGAATVLQSAAGELLVAAQLPPLAPEQVYQLWLIGDSGAPQSGGVFSVGSSGLGLIALGPGTPADVTLAVTAEPAPGSPGPTGPILVQGRTS